MIRAIAAVLSLVLPLFLCAESKASDSGTGPSFSLVYMPASVHHTGRDDYNEKQNGWGIAGEWEGNGNNYSMVAMRYKNSHFEMSTLVGFSRHDPCLKWFSCSYGIIGATGYDIATVTVAPVIGIGFDWIHVVHVPLTVTTVMFKLAEF